MAALHLPAPAGRRAHGYVLRPGELKQTVGGWGWTVLHDLERAARPATGDDRAGGAAGIRADDAEPAPGVAEIIARRPTTRPAPRA